MASHFNNNNNTVLKVFGSNYKVIVGVLFVLFIAVGATVGRDIHAFIWRGDMEATIKGHHFFIPADETIERAASPIYRSITGLGGRNDAVVFAIDADEVAMQIPGYKKVEEGHPLDVRGIIRVWDPIRIEQYRKPERYQDLWYGQGSYKARLIEPQPGAPLYRVYRNSEKRNTWVVLNQEPMPGVSQPLSTEDYWVARCSRQKSFTPMTEAFVLCNSYFFSDDIVVEFYLAEDNLPHIAAVRDIIELKLRSWKKAV